MKELDFCYWLQGCFELGGVTEFNAEQTQIIKDHLQLVFKKETPLTTTQQWWQQQQPVRTMELRHEDMLKAFQTDPNKLVATC